jgi:hypothetical protein
MMLIGICHIYNEEYLLKWWIPHHKNKFDHCLFIDYASTDNSLQVIKDLAPNWEVVQSANKYFRAADIDSEVMHYEKAIQSKFRFAWVVALNVTEFLVGNTKRLKKAYNSPKQIREQILIPCHVMVDSVDQKFSEPDVNVPLIDQRSRGILCEYSEDTIYNPYCGKLDKLAIEQKKDFDNRKMRSMHNYPINYFETSAWSVGRHYWGTPNPDFAILWYGHSPMTESLVKRKTSIQDKIPKEDFDVGNGIQHKNNRDIVLARYEFHDQFAVDLSDYINSLESKQ